MREPTLASCVGSALGAGIPHSAIAGLNVDCVHKALAEDAQQVLETMDIPKINLLRFRWDRDTVAG